MESTYRLLADVVVIAHFVYVLSVVLGLAAILVGYVLEWKWVRNFSFRIIHLAMILIVVAETLLGIVCPLTTLEDYLRTQAGQTHHAGSFIGRWAHELMFFEGPEWVFALAYCVFGLVVLAALFLAPPQRRRRHLAKTSNAPEST